MQTKKVHIRVLFLGYQIVRSIRIMLLTTVFGYVSHCPQQPSCGTFMLQQCEQKGLSKGMWLGVNRALRCTHFNQVVKTS